MEWQPYYFFMQPAKHKKKFSFSFLIYDIKIRAQWLEWSSRFNGITGNATLLWEKKQHLLSERHSNCLLWLLFLDMILSCWVESGQGSNWLDMTVPDAEVNWQHFPLSVSDSFYSRAFEKMFQQCLELPSQSRYSISFPLLCTHFMSCTHELCPEEVSRADAESVQRALRGTE